MYVFGSRYIGKSSLIKHLQGSWNENEKYYEVDCHIVKIINNIRYGMIVTEFHPSQCKFSDIDRIRFEGIDEKSWCIVSCW